MPGQQLFCHSNGDNQRWAEQARQAELKQTAEEQAARIIRDAETEVKRLHLVYKEEEVQKRNELEAEQVKRRKDLERIEERLQNRLDSAERRLAEIEAANANSTSAKANLMATGETGRPGRKAAHGPCSGLRSRRKKRHARPC